LDLQGQDWCLQPNLLMYITLSLCYNQSEGPDAALGFYDTK